MVSGLLDWVGDILFLAGEGAFSRRPLWSPAPVSRPTPAFSSGAMAPRTATYSSSELGSEWRALECRDEPSRSPSVTPLHSKLPSPALTTTLKGIFAPSSIGKLSNSSDKQTSNCKCLAQVESLRNLCQILKSLKITFHCGTIPTVPTGTLIKGKGDALWLSNLVSRDGRNTWRALISPVVSPHFPHGEPSFPPQRTPIPFVVSPDCLQRSPHFPLGKSSFPWGKP